MIRNICVLVLLSVIVIFAGTQVIGETMSTAGPGSPLDVALSPLNEIEQSASGPTAMLQDAATQVDATPAGCHTMYFCTGSMAANLGNASVTSDPYGGILVATNSYLAIPLRRDLGRPNIWYIGRSGTAGDSTIRIWYWK